MFAVRNPTLTRAALPPTGFAEIVGNNLPILHRAGLRLVVVQNGLRGGFESFDFLNLGGLLFNGGGSGALLSVKYWQSSNGVRFQNRFSSMQSEID
jgi:hypothetical protein